jgi:Rieske Fe-S protein
MNNILRLLLLSLLFMQCHTKNKDDEIPAVPVNIYIDLNINTSAPLSVLGGYIYVTGGNKGIIVLHNFDDNFLAIERTCSYHPYDACNLITVDSGGVFYKCGKYNGSNFEACCGSQFTLDGFVSKGPASRPLRTYTTSKSGSQLHIFN